MLTVSILAAPDRANLSDTVIDALRAQWEGSKTTWLSPTVAAEFEISARPNGFEQTAARLRAEGFDLNLVHAGDRRKKLLLADMDSTMIDQECIDELAAEASVGEHVAQITARAMNGELDFNEALIERVSLLAGLSESVIEKVLAGRITLASGGKTLIATMRAKGAYTALVSGGFTAFTGPIAQRLGFDEHRSNTLLAQDGALTGKVAMPILGQQAKLDALNEIATRMGLDLSQTMAVGDGANDLAMITAAGAGIALHAKPVVAEQAPLRIDHGDLTALLFLQGYHRDDFASTV